MKGLAVGTLCLGFHKHMFFSLVAYQGMKQHI